MSNNLNSLIPHLILSVSLLGTMNDPDIVPLASVVKLEEPSGCAVKFLSVLPKSESPSE